MQRASWSTHCLPTSQRVALPLRCTHKTIQRFLLQYLQFTTQTYRCRGITTLKPSPRCCASKMVKRQIAHLAGAKMHGKNSRALQTLVQIFLSCDQVVARSVLTPTWKMNCACASPVPHCILDTLNSQVPKTNSSRCSPAAGPTACLLFRPHLNACYACSPARRAAHKTLLPLRRRTWLSSLSKKLQLTQ